MCRKFPTILLKFVLNTFQHSQFNYIVRIGIDVKCLNVHTNLQYRHKRNLQLDLPLETI